MKKSKVIKIVKMDKKDDYGNTSFIIEFENGDKGYYRSKNEDQKKFIVEQEAEYLIEEKTGKNNSKYFKITTPQTDAPFNRGGGKPQIDPKVQMISFAAAYTKDLIVAGKADIKEFGSQFNSIYSTMISKI